MPKLFWLYTCHQCHCPLDIHYHFDTYDEFKLMTKYKKLFPFFLDANASMYKFYGLKVYRVCTYCFKNKVVYNPRKDALRQIGLIRNLVPRNKCKTKNEIGAWFYMFERLVKKKRLNDCAVP